MPPELLFVAFRLVRCGLDLTAAAAVEADVEAGCGGAVHSGTAAEAEVPIDGEVIVSAGPQVEVKSSKDELIVPSVSMMA